MEKIVPTPRVVRGKNRPHHVDLWLDDAEVRALLDLGEKLDLTDQGVLIQALRHLQIEVYADEQTDAPGCIGD